MQDFPSNPSLSGYFMAPILKELETPVATTTTTTASAPAAPHAKQTNETPVRPQPVALEIPVSVNGARTVDGSDKRIPFSETTQTVLVFPHGAVIRITTPLASGQLVFLTNEKTKKEVVCQVVKAKSTGNSAAYVELQFTEPAPGFWGIQVPGASSVPPAPRPVAPPSSLAPMAATPAQTVAAKSPLIARQATSPAIAPPPVRPVAPPPAIPSAPVMSRTESVAPAIPVSPAPVTALPHLPVPPAPVDAKPAAPVALRSLPPGTPESPVTPPPPPISVVVPASEPHQHTSSAPPPPLRDYAKEINTLFASPQAPAASVKPEAPAVASKSVPTSEELKQHTARLQAQLSSLLFSETPAAPSTITAPPKLETPVAEVAQKFLEIAQEDPKPAAQPETQPVAQIEEKPIASSRKPAIPSLGADEEVKIPSWLAPLSQSSESSVAAEPAESAAASENQAVSVNSEESYDALVGETPKRPETAVFGGQLLGESAASAEAPASGSKKGLLFGLAAAALLIAGGAWYYFHNYSGAASAPPAHSSSLSPSTAPEPASNLPSTPVATAAPHPVESSPAPASAPPPKNVTPAPRQEVSEDVTPSKNSKVAPSNAAAVEAPAKPSLGEVHLAAPVVNRSAGSQSDGESLQSIDTKTIPSASDPLAAAATRHSAPVAPLPVGGDVKAAQLLKSVPPEYPAIARAQHVFGKVLIDALIDASGNVATVKVISGPPLLHRAALESVKQWKYTPAVLDGLPTSMHLTVTVEFRNQ